MLQLHPAAPVEPDPSTRDFYVACLRTLDDARVPYVVGGGYAMAYYTGIARQTKDLDIFIKPEDRDRCLQTLGDAGFKTEFFYPFWISKAVNGEAFMDIIYNSANGICVVDDEWLEHGIDVEVLDHPTRLCPAEEQLWSKAFVQDRDRFDGADIHHLILARGDQFDWERLLRRFRQHERVLLAHLIMFDYAYPNERHIVPRWVRDRIDEAIAGEPPVKEKIARGTFVSQRGYLHDVHEWGYKDARLRPRGPLSREQLDQLPTP